MAVVQTSKAATFDQMINEYLPYDLLMEEYKKMDWLMQNANMKEGWLGGTLIVPYQSSYASSVKMGGLTNENEIDEATYVRGQVDGYKEVWASLVFNSRDLMEHDKVSEQNFLQILPNQLDQTLGFMKEQVSIAVLNTSEITTVVSITNGDGSNPAVLVVSHPERLEIGMKVLIRDAANTENNAWITEINRNTGAVSVVDAFGGSGYTADLVTAYPSGADLYLPDTYNSSTFNGFSSLLYQILPAGYLGAPATVFGANKTASPFTQGLLYDAADWANGDAATGTEGAGNKITDSTDVLAEIFNGLAKARQRGSDPDAFLMSYKHFSAVLAALEYGSGGRTLGSGAFKNIQNKVDYAGFSEVTIGSVYGSVKLVAIREMTDKIILGIQTKKLDFHTNRGFKIQESPDGLKFYSVRQTTGYRYIVDYSFYGEFVYSCPYTAISITMPSTYTGIPDFLI